MDEFLLLSIQCTGVIILGVVGLIGISQRQRGSRKERRQRRYLTILTCASIVVSLAAIIIGHFAEEARMRDAKMVAEAARFRDQYEMWRLQNPLERLAVTLFLDVSVDDPVVAQYVSRLKQDPDSDITYPIEPNTSGFPNADVPAERELAECLALLNPRVDVYLNASEREVVNAINADATTLLPDLSFHLHGGLHDDRARRLERVKNDLHDGESLTPASLYYFPSERSLLISWDQAPVKYTWNSPDIVSTIDLERAIILLELDGFHVLKGVAVNQFILHGELGKQWLLTKGQLLPVSRNRTILMYRGARRM